jgi:hypothetical protein
MTIKLALSIQQPFAELILVGRKKFEYRTIQTRIRERVYIYASKKNGPASRWKASGYQPGSLPTGVLVGTIEIAQCLGSPGDYRWRLTDPRRLKKPIIPQNRPQPVWFRPFSKNTNLARRCINRGKSAVTIHDNVSM